MKTNEYKTAKLAIYERAYAGEITESQRDDLIQLLEEKKSEDDLTPDKIEEFFDQLSSMYPNCKDAIEKLADKISKSDDTDEDEESDDVEESTHSEAFDNLLNMINN